MFSGIGGFELGIERAFRVFEGKKQTEAKRCTSCIGYSEIDKYARRIYERHFPDHKWFGDATRINPDELPDFDMLCGGFPCQAFSIAGKRGGLEDTRGTLFYEIARIASVKRPKLLFLENVKGLLSHDKGRTFGTILSTFSELGYILEWQVLNSKDFGVPQNRERVFIIGHLGARCGRSVFPIGETCPESFEIQLKAERERQGIQGEFSETKRDKECVEGGGQRERRLDMSLKELTQNQSQGYRVYDIDGVASTLAGEAGGVGAKTGLYAIAVLTPNRAEKRQAGRRFKEDGEPAFTVTVQDKHGVFNGQRIRRLTPTECERLQGFPDGWTEDISDSQRYKCLGNAVTVNVIQAIVERIIYADIPSYD